MMVFITCVFLFGLLFCRPFGFHPFCVLELLWFSWFLLGFSSLFSLASLIPINIQPLVLVVLVCIDFKSSCINIYLEGDGGKTSGAKSSKAKDQEKPKTLKRSGSASKVDKPKVDASEEKKPKKKSKTEEDGASEEQPKPKKKSKSDEDGAEKAKSKGSKKKA